MTALRCATGVVGILLCCLGSQSSAQSRSVAVSPDFAGRKGAATNLSGMACAEPDDANTRLCLAVDDEASFAQWVTFDGARLVPGERVALDSLPGSAGDFVPRCAGGPAKHQDADGEAVAYVAPYWYVTGSHGCSRHKDQHSVRAFSLYRVPRGATRADASTARLAIALRSLRETRAFAERCLEDVKVPSDRRMCPEDPPNGVTVEGLAGMAGSLLVGLRAPSVAGDALVLRFGVADLFGSRADPPPAVVRLRLGLGSGVRDLAPLPDGRLLILSGPAQSQDVPFALHVLQPNGATVPIQRWSVPAGDGSAKPESLTVLSSDATRASILLMKDGPVDGAPELVEIALPALTPAAGAHVGEQRR